MSENNNGKNIKTEFVNFSPLVTKEEKLECADFLEKATRQTFRMASEAGPGTAAALNHEVQRSKVTPYILWLRGQA